MLRFYAFYTFDASSSVTKSASPDQDARSRVSISHTFTESWPEGISSFPGSAPVAAPHVCYLPGSRPRRMRSWENITSKSSQKSRSERDIKFPPEPGHRMTDYVRSIHHIWQFRSTPLKADYSRVMPFFARMYVRACMHIYINFFFPLNNYFSFLFYYYYS